MTIDCPECDDPLAEIPPSGIATAVCPKCRYTYRVLHGEIVNRVCSLITVRRATDKREGAYKQRYGLRFQRADGSPEDVEFEIAGEDDILDLGEGNLVTTVHTLKGGAPEDLIVVGDESAGTVTRLARPGDRARTSALSWSLLLVFVLLIPFTQLFSRAVGWLVPLGIGAVCWVFLRSWLPPRVPKKSRELRGAAEKDHVLHKREELVASRARHQEHRVGRKSLKKRLDALRKKMKATGEEMYASRIQTIGRAVELLDQQIRLDDRLIERHDKLIAMVEIEMETGSLADELPSATLDPVLAKLDELRELERQNDTLQAELALNEEMARVNGGA